MEYEFLILHEINQKIKVGKCQVLSVAMNKNKRVLSFTFTLFVKNICGCKRIGLPVSKDLLIKFRERKKEINITKLEK